MEEKSPSMFFVARGERANSVLRAYALGQSARAGRALDGVPLRECDDDVAHHQWRCMLE